MANEIVNKVIAELQSWVDEAQKEFEETDYYEDMYYAEYGSRIIEGLKIVNEAGKWD